MSKQYTEWELIDVASEPDATPDEMKAALECKRSYVRKELALNPNCPIEYLKILAVDKRITVRWNVVRNREASREALRLMKDEKHVSILRDLLLHPNCPKEVYDHVKTRNVKHKWIEYALIKKGGYNLAELQEYLFSHNSKVRKAAAISIRRFARQELKQ